MSCWRKFSNFFFKYCVCCLKPNSDEPRDPKEPRYPEPKELGPEPKELGPEPKELGPEPKELGPEPDANPITYGYPRPRELAYS